MKDQTGSIMFDATVQAAEAATPSVAGCNILMRTVDHIFYAEKGWV